MKSRGVDLADYVVVVPDGPHSHPTSDTVSERPAVSQAVPHKLGMKLGTRGAPDRASIGVSTSQSLKGWRRYVQDRGGRQAARSSASGSTASATPSADVWFTVACRLLQGTVKGTQTIAGGIDPRAPGRALVGAPWPI